MTTLIVAEKPSSSLKIAQALATGKIQKKTNKGVTYYQIKRGKDDILVAPAVGHLFVLSEKKGKWRYPVFDMMWKPVYENKRAGWSKKYFQNLEALAKKADHFISACDYDVEGSVIAFNILRFICNVEDGKRMKFSTLTQSDLVSAFEKASPHLDFGMIHAGIARHHLDYLWGINVSRALIASLKEAGTFRILSTGRVQGPALEILEEREKEIGAFKPKPFWELHLTTQLQKQEVLAFHVNGKFWKKNEATAIHKKCNKKDGTITGIETSTHKQHPPVPFDLTTLQREAYGHFGYSPKQTLDIAQSLYEKGAISYPRTASQKLPAKLGFKVILAGLKTLKPYAGIVDEVLKTPLKPNEGKKTDPAHPAIYPTAEVPRLKDLTSVQKKMYDLIVKRFFAVFGSPGVRETVKVIITIEKEDFHAEGLRTLEPGWMAWYAPYVKVKEQILPPVKKGDMVKNKKLEMIDKETQPPNRYTQASLLKKLEDLGLGTKATRAHILQTLYDRGYIEERSIEVTQLGEAVITALTTYCHDIISPDLTRTFEEQMEAIQDGKRTWEDVVKEARTHLEKHLTMFKENEKKIGESLLKGLAEFRKQESTVGPCKCGGTLVKRRSRAGKPFVGCDKYPKCTETFSLPHSGTAKPTDKTCECGLFILLVKRPGKRPWKLCVRDGFKK